MRPFWTIALALMIPVALLGAEPATPDGQEILRRVDDMWRGESSAGLMTMKIKTAHWERTLKMKGYSKGKELSLMRIVYPKSEAGTGTLKVDDNIWNYLPKTRRVMKVPSSMMMGSWMGSHFTNDDLVKESRLEDDYDFELLQKTAEDGTLLYEITLLPKQEAAVVWGKIVITVQADDLVPVLEEFYDEDGELVRRMTFGNVTVLQDRTVPLTLKIVPVDKPEEYTEIIYEKLLFDIPIEDDFFSLQNLKRR
jgi:outer membrane lipoprotein-sorting protein